MNILYYDKSTTADCLYELWESLKSRFPEGDLLFLPNSVELLMEVSAEELFGVGDQISIALEKIKEERPEEYEKAYNNRMVTIRDKQWKEVVKKQIEAHNKRNH